MHVSCTYNIKKLKNVKIVRFCRLYIQPNINSLLFHINLVSGDCMHKHDPEAV